MSTPKNTRCKYPHRIGVRVDDELYVKILNGAIKCDLSPSEFFRQLLKSGGRSAGKRLPWYRRKCRGSLKSTVRLEMSSTIWPTASTLEARWTWTAETA